MNGIAVSAGNSNRIVDVLTHHARKRMGMRGISSSAIQAALDYGRVVHTRGADIFVIGRKEVVRLAKSSIDVSDYEGVQVVCAAGGPILTVYRNKNFRGLRPRWRRG